MGPKAAAKPDPKADAAVSVELTEEVLHAQRHAACDAFIDHSIAELAAVDVAQELVDRACDLYITTSYDRLAVDYTVLSLWHDMTSVVALETLLPCGPPVHESRGGPMPSSPQHSGFTPRGPALSGGSTSPTASALKLPDAATPPPTNVRGKAKAPAPKGKAAKGPARRTVTLADAGHQRSESPASSVASKFPSPGRRLSLDEAATPGPLLPPEPAALVPTWDADDAPDRIPCDQHTRHNIPLKLKPKKEATKDGKDRPMSHHGEAERRRARRSRHTASSGLTAGALSDAGSSRPPSRGSSIPDSELNATTRSTEASKPSPKTDASSKRRMSRVAPPPTAAETTTAPLPAEATLTAEEMAIIAQVEEAEERKKQSIRVREAITQQLADPRVTEKGFVVDSASGKVVPLVTPEEVLHQAKKLAEPLRFSLPEPPHTAPASFATPAGQRSGIPSKPTGKKSERSGGRPREENFFVPDTTSVAMVQPLAPSGGVAVKDTDGIPKSTELRLPKNKMSRQEFSTIVKSQNTAAGALTPPSESLQPTSVEASSVPQLSLNPSPSKAGKDAAAKPANTARAGQATKPDGQKPPQPNTARRSSEVAGLPKPPNTAGSVARRLPMTPAATESGSVSRKSRARAAAAESAAGKSTSQAVVAKRGALDALLADDNAV